jgi:hypothetical protein
MESAEISQAPPIWGRVRTGGEVLNPGRDVCDGNCLEVNKAVAAIGGTFPPVDSQREERAVVQQEDLRRTLECHDRRLCARYPVPTCVARGAANDPNMQPLTNDRRCVSVCAGKVCLAQCSRSTRGLCDRSVREAVVLFDQRVAGEHQSVRGWSRFHVDEDCGGLARKMAVIVRRATVARRKDGGGVRRQLSRHACSWTTLVVPRAMATSRPGRALPRARPVASN